MCNNKNNYRFIFIIILFYAFSGVIYIFLDTKDKISISNPIGATLYDQDHYHIPQINYFLQNQINLLSYKSFTATSPGQHLIYAGILSLFNIKKVDSDTIELRLLHFFINILVIFSIWFLFYSIYPSYLATIYILPLIFSPYFINGALYVTTDNIAIGLIAATLLFIFKPKYETKNILFANLLNTFSLFFRQNTVWLQIPISIQNISVILKTKKYCGLLTHILPFGLMILFLITWCGLTPKEFQHINSKSLNFSSIIYSISLFAILSSFYFFDFRDFIKSIDKQIVKKLIFYGVIVGLSLSILIPSNMSHEKGRWGGYLWGLSAHLPYIFERSFMFISLTIFGSVILSFIFYILYNRNGYLIMISFLAWLISTIGSFIVFHRYFEPILILFISIFSLFLRPKNKRFSYGPVILAVTMFLMFLSSFIL